MPIDPLPNADAQTQHLIQMESSIEAINVRIARLAMALGVSLNNEHEVALIMSRPQAVSMERRTSVRTDVSPDRRMAHLREELRGLLVLRYSIEESYVDDVGVTVTRQIMVEAEEHLVRRGFKPGADGIDLDRLFNKS